MKLVVAGALALSLISMTFTSVGYAADTNSTLISSTVKAEGSGNINDVYQAISNLQEAIRIMNSMLQNNEIVFSSEVSRKKFYTAHEGMLQGFALLKEFLTALASKSLKENQSASQIIDNAKNLIWDSYWAFNQMLFLNEMEFKFSAGDYKFHRAHSKERVALQLVRTYLYGASK